MTTLTYNESTQQLFDVFTAHDGEEYAWLKIEPSLTDWEDCDCILIDVNEDQIEVDIRRIPNLIEALKQAQALAGGGQ